MFHTTKSMFQKLVILHHNMRGCRLYKCFIRQSQCFKSLTTPKEKSKGPFGIFLYPVCRKSQKKFPLGKNFFQKKSRNAEKTERGTLWSRPAWYVMRETFWFCSQGQQVKFEIL